MLAARSAIYKSTFYNKKGFDDWNCGKITTCGDFGAVCGGYGVKGKGSDIKKTFNLPAGIYSVQLDFLRIDSWFVCVMLWACSSKFQAEYNRCLIVRYIIRSD